MGHRVHTQTGSPKTGSPKPDRINNFGATTSISSLHEALRKNGHQISKQTLTRYIDALVNARVLHECGRFNLKSRKFLSGEKKYYIADLAFYFALNT